MHDTSLLRDLAVVMIVAGLVTVVFHRFKQPVVLGYILAGVIIGPHTPPFPLIRDEEAIETLSELGVVMLMFSLGLEFSLRKLRQVGTTAFIAAAMEILLMLWAGYEIGRLFGWKQMDCIFLGAILSISSTTIIIKALGELGKSKESFAELIFGILIVEDILAIVMIALLSGLAQSGSLQPEEVVSTMARLGIFLVVLLVAGLLTVPRLLRYVAGFKSNEMLLITVLGLCFGVSFLAVELGYSVALGAFIIGAVIAEAREIGRIGELMEPLRDMFSAVFFVAIGLLIQPALLVRYALPIAIITVVVVAGKVLTCSLGTFVAGHDSRTSLRVGVGLAQIGEFSFIIASLGISLKVTSDFLYPIAVTVSAITTLLTPYLIRSSDGLVAWFDRAAPRRLVGHLELYSRWVEQFRKGRRQDPARRHLRRMAWQMTVNSALIAGIFIAAAFAADLKFNWMPIIPEHLGGARTLFWFAAMLLSLPLYIATLRKLQALGMLVSEMSVKRAVAGEKTAPIRAAVANTVLVTGIVGLVLLTLVLSSALLPPSNVLIVLTLLVAAVGWVQWRSFVKIYAKAQFDIEEALSETPAAAQHEVGLTPSLGILKSSQLEAVPIGGSSFVIGKLIREIQLRPRTGASIIGIERNGESIVNPGPDEEIQNGDVVFLFGHPDQLRSARALLTEQPGLDALESAETAPGL